MIFTSGNYINLTDSDLDIFIIFNEGNDSPTIEEYEKISKLVEKEVDNMKRLGVTNYDLLHSALEEAIDLSNYNCVQFGVQIIINNR